MTMPQTSESILRLRTLCVKLQDTILSSTGVSTGARSALTRYANLIQDEVIKLPERLRADQTGQADDESCTEDCDHDVGVHWTPHSTAVARAEGLI